MISCNSSFEQVGENISETVFEVSEKDLIPEGITFDVKTDRFFLSSKNKDKVIAIDKNGNHSDFIKTRQDSMLGSLGLKIDSERRRLWTVSNRLFGNRKISIVHVFDADSGELINRFYAPSDKQYHLNDLVLTNEGTAYITDTQSSCIFMIPHDLSRMELFIVDSLIYAPNGITISPDNTILYVESHYNGIQVVDLNTKDVSPIGNTMHVETGGIDGLVYYKNSLIGIVNAQYEEYEYIVQYRLSNNGCDIISASIIDKANPKFNTPTTGVIVHDSLYILATTSLHVYNDNQMENEELLKNPLILKYNLK